MSSPNRSSTPTLLIVVAWLLVSIPLAYGLVRTVITAAPLFTGG
ncbi:MFS transporter small subunit [Klenkia taihuensis]|uniref:Uncharacterized protein n=1 Tax=Klenkia taihuensis TaxID=1225127 RepID=A0A1I1ISR3_9ACTN|nr:hypothetical protein [Klenkia taihuensis]GHE08570.1 hypothetical protein GCM10011381_09550 [Klenkia taihuensis]SFC36260.1 hypothetical protein SAMN05661030_0782 [Klenkia taihuensis]